MEEAKEKDFGRGCWMRMEGEGKAMDRSRKREKGRAHMGEREKEKGTDGKRGGQWGKRKRRGVRGRGKKEGWKILKFGA